MSRLKLGLAGGLIGLLLGADSIAASESKPAETTEAVFCKGHVNMETLKCEDDPCDVGETCCGCATE